MHLIITSKPMLTRIVEIPRWRSEPLKCLWHGIVGLHSMDRTDGDLLLSPDATCCERSKLPTTIAPLHENNHFTAGRNNAGGRSLMNVWMIWYSNNLVLQYNPSITHDTSMSMCSTCLIIHVPHMHKPFEAYTLFIIAQQTDFIK